MILSRTTLKTCQVLFIDYSLLICSINFNFVVNPPTTDYNIHHDVDIFMTIFLVIFTRTTTLRIRDDLILFLFFSFINPNTIFMDIFMLFLFLFFQNIPQTQYSLWCEGIKFSNVFINVPCFFKKKKKKKLKRIFTIENQFFKKKKKKKTSFEYVIYENKSNRSVHKKKCFSYITTDEFLRIFF